MPEEQLEHDNPSRDAEGLPLVAVICHVPLLFHVVSSALVGVGEVRAFPAGRGDTVGLLRWLGPDAIVVDDVHEAEAAALFAGEADTPLLHVSLREDTVRVLRGGLWEPHGDGVASAETIRNMLLGALFGKRRRR